MWRLASTGLLYFSKCPEPSASKGSALTRLAPFFSMAGFRASILRIKNPLCTKQSILLALEMAFGEKDGGGVDHWSISQNDKKDWAKILRTSAFDGERQLWGQADQFLRRFVVRIQLKEFYWVAFFDGSKYFCNNTKSKIANNVSGFW